MKKVASFMILFMVLLMVLTTTAFAEKLPVFKLKKVQADRGKADAILTDMHKGQAPGQIQKTERADAIVSSAGQKKVEINKASGKISAADHEKFLNPGHKPNLPSHQQTKAIADNFINKHKLMSDVDGKHSHVSFNGVSETKTGSTAPGSQPFTLHSEVHYDVKVNVNRGGRAVSLPVVGGGGKFKVSVGDKGDVVGYHGQWKGIEKVNSEEEILSQAEAEKKFRAAAPGMNLARMESSLAYFASSTEQQDLMAPVWVIKGSQKIGNEEVPFRSTIIAATKYGPSAPIEQAPPRNPNAPLPQVLSEGKQDGWHFVTPAWAETSYKTFGVEYIGVSGGLAQSAANAAGFRNVMTSRGWTSKFHYGDANAYESDWRRNNNNYVDNVDFVFYTGHANANGWVLSAPDDNFLHYTEVQSMYPDLYGNNQLEWLIIAACGPLQTSSINKWWHIFNKLHVLMGYGTVTYDNSVEGQKVATYATNGMPIIDAWFRAAEEAQPSGCLAVVMYAPNMRYDRIWGAGYTYPDPAPNQTLYWISHWT